MKLGEITERIQTGYSHGVKASSSRLETRFIYGIMKTTRARLMSQKSRKRQHISLWNYQVLPCIEFIKVAKHLCPCIPPLGCYIWRSKHKLPEIINDLNGHMVQFVSNITNDKTVTGIEPQQVKYLNGDKYTSGNMRYFILDDYMWVVNEGGKDPLLMMAAIFQDPIEAADFASYCDDKDGGCDDCNECIARTDFDFDMSESEIDALVALTITEIQQWFSQNREDKQQDASDDNIAIQRNERKSS